MRQAQRPPGSSTTPGSLYRASGHDGDDSPDARTETSTKPASPGREDELRGLAEAVSQHRLVTVTGAPGVGKSHLAIQAAHRLAAAGELDAVVVGLAGLVDAEQVAAAVARAVGTGKELGFSSGPIRSAAGQPVLVVLDDCDHLVEACAQAAESLLAADVRVLATSREPLWAPAEIVWQLGTLSLPHPGSATLPEAFGDSEAVQLFCERAAAAARGFVPTADNVAAIVEICRRLDGLPLAIELAASRAGVLSPAEIVAQLDHPLRLLTRAPRTAPARHQSLRRALESSWEPLSVPEQVLLGRLSLFAATFTAEAARDVCVGGEVAADDLFDVLSALIEKSLVVAETVDRGTRYHLLGVIRHFAAEKLAVAGESDAVAACHARWCSELVARASDLRPEVPRWIERLEPELDDIAAAFSWAAAAGWVEAASLGMAELLLFQIRGDDAEALALLEQILPLVGDLPAQVRASVLCYAGAVATTEGNLAVAAARLEASMAAAREAADVSLEARAGAMSGFVSVLAGEEGAGFRALDDAVDLARSAGDDDCLAQALGASARAHLLVGDMAAARRKFAENLDLAIDSGNRSMLTSALLGLGCIAVVGGGYHEGHRHLTEALGLAREQGDPHAASLALAWLGELARLQGDEEGAKAALLECLNLAEEADVPFPRAKGLIGLGRLAQGQDDLARAQSCFEKALAVARSHGLTHLVSPCLHGLGQVARAAGTEEPAQSLLEEALATADACGDKHAQAQALDELARMVGARGEHRRAATLHRRALALRHHIADPAEVADSLEGVGALRAAIGDLAEAARLFGAAQSLRDAHGCVRPGPHRADNEPAVGLARQRLGADRFQAEWSAGMALSLEEAVAKASGPGRRAKRPPSGPEALTPAEREVAALAGAGLTNEAIARQLVLSRRTVETHLQRVYSKLGISSRRDLKGLSEEARGFPHGIEM